MADHHSAENDDLAPAQLFSLDGRTALVTGASRGIGEMIAAGLLAGGARVLLCARRRDTLRDAVDRLAAIGPCEPIIADVSSVAGVHALAAEVHARTTTLDLLVNNAGTAWGAPLDDHPEHGWDRVVDLNLKGPFFLTQALLGRLRAAASPSSPSRVVMIGSIDGIDAPRTPSYGYAASKAGLHHLTRHLAKELAADHITVNAIAPGLFPSRMTRFAVDDDELRGALEASIPLGRLGRPADIAGAVLFLASRAGSYVTGTVVTVDGGRTGAGRSDVQALV